MLDMKMNIFRKLWFRVVIIMFSGFTTLLLSFTSDFYEWSQLIAISLIFLIYSMLASFLILIVVSEFIEKNKKVEVEE